MKGRETMVVKIQKASIKKMKVVYNKQKKTMDQLQKELGCQCIINLTLFNMSDFTPASYLSVDGILLGMAGNPYGFAVNGDKIVFSYANNVNYPDFAGCYHVLVRDGENMVTSDVNSKYGYAHRSAVGLTKSGDVVLLCDVTNRSLDGIAGDLIDAGCDVALNYDGGGSCQCITPDGTIRSSRIVLSYLAIWTEEEQKEPEEDPEEETEDKKTMKILLISGHGAGDSGAVSSINGITYQEADETRKMTAAIKQALGKSAEVQLYPTDRNANDDFKKGTLASMAQFSQYDYVLEIHLNAFQAGASDGKTKGVECYVTTAETGITVEEAICEKVAAVGFENRGVKRTNFNVIQAAKSAGVSSALLEVCFIDDPDDMAVYTANRDKIAAAIADGIREGFGLQDSATVTPDAPPVEEDAPADPWYTEDIAWAKELGIMDGTRPTEPATRAETVAMLRRGVDHVLSVVGSGHGPVN